MAVEIGSIAAGGLKPVAAGVAKAKPAGGGAGFNFADSLTKLIDGVEESEGQANQAVTAMVNKTGEVHDAMIALQNAQMQLELTVTIRNKLMAAYQDIMRQPV